MYRDRNGGFRLRRGLSRVVVLTTVVFIGCTFWVLYQADMGKDSAIFDWVRSLPNGDKLGHFMVFGVMTLLLNVSLNFSTVRLLFIPVYWGTFSVALFSLGEEISQYFIPSRTFDLLDLVADAGGILTFTHDYMVSGVLAWKTYTEMMFISAPVSRLAHAAEHHFPEKLSVFPFDT